MYLIHPEKILGRSNSVTGSPSKNTYSVTSLGVRKDLELKSKMRKWYVNALSKLGEDKDTFMNFYAMK